VLTAPARWRSSHSNETTGVSTSWRASELAGRHHSRLFLKASLWPTRTTGSLRKAQERRESSRGFDHTSGRNPRDSSPAASQRTWKTSSLAAHIAVFLSWLQSDEELRRDLQAADVVTMLICNDEWAVPSVTAAGVGGRNPADCGGDDNRQCLRDMERLQQPTEPPISAGIWAPRFLCPGDANL